MRIQFVSGGQRPERPWKNFAGPPAGWCAKTPWKNGCGPGKKIFLFPQAASGPKKPPAAPPVPGMARAPPPPLAPPRPLKRTCKTSQKSEFVVFFLNAGFLSEKKITRKRKMSGAGPALFDATHFTGKTGKGFPPPPPCCFFKLPTFFFKTKLLFNFFSGRAFFSPPPPR